ncbi:MAG: DUF2188 domain-containing protein [Pseudomonadota bacterium]
MVRETDHYRIYQTPFGWKLRKGGNPRATRVADNKEEIIRLAQELLGNQFDSIKIYNIDGSLNEERVFEAAPASCSVRA